MSLPLFLTLSTSITVSVFLSGAIYAVLFGSELFDSIIGELQGATHVKVINKYLMTLFSSLSSSSLFFKFHSSWFLHFTFDFLCFRYLFYFFTYFYFLHLLNCQFIVLSIYRIINLLNYQFTILSTSSPSLLARRW